MAHDVLPGDLCGAKEGLHGGLAVAPAAMKGAIGIVAGEPDVEVGLQLFVAAVDLLVEGDALEHELRSNERSSCSRSY